MNPAYFVYNLIVSGLIPVVIPPMWLYQRRQGAHSMQLHHRLGIYSNSLRNAMAGRAKIWLHAASVGEVGVALSIIRALRRLHWDSQIVVSTTTEQGLALALTDADDYGPCFFAPLDWLPAVRKAVDLVKPDLLAILETEIWPNLLTFAHRRGVRTAIINGRISTRTVHRYQKIKPLMRHSLSQVDAFSMISETDAQRVRSIGAPAERIWVKGNAKFDAVDPNTDGHRKSWARSLIDPDHRHPSIFVAGSTRAPEEKAILDAFIRMRHFDPHLIMIIAPRHIQRCDQIEQWIVRRGLSCQRRTRIGSSVNRGDGAGGGGGGRRTAPIVLLDTIGELTAIYGIADVVFCGGSLVPKGGQNVLEPAFWGKPIIYGPSMEDFAQARDLIEKAGGGVCVSNAEELAKVVVDWLQHPEKARRVGEAARLAIVSQSGAAQRHAELLLGLLRKAQQ